MERKVVINMFDFTKKKKLSYAYDNLITISQLKDVVGEFSYTVKRSNIKLYVIDDEGFDSDPLSSVGYQSITKCTKFESHKYFEDADVILCDIDGIGCNLDNQRQGISVAENLKAIYPDKLVVLYTSKNADEYGGVPSSLDGKISKSGTMSDLAFEIDELIKKSKDVVNVWNNIQKEMIEKNYSMKTITFTEHFYCKSLIEKNNMFDKKEVVEFVNKENIHRFVKILTDIIAIYSAV